MRLEPIIDEHPPINCIRCNRRFEAGVIYIDIDVDKEEHYYCRQCADEMCCFPPYRTARRVTA
jgi:hypothetical protein